MKVVFFEGTATKPLEEKINDWFKGHPNLASVNIVQTVTPGKNDKPGLIIISLWYQEATGPPPGLDKIMRARGMPPGFKRPVLG